MKTKKEIIVRDSMECQSCVSGREDVNEKLDREIARDYSTMCFALLGILIVIYVSIGTLKWTIAKLGIVLVWWQFALVFGALWFIVIGVIVYLGMRKAKVK